MIDAKYFRSEEFDSPDLPGSGSEMDEHFIAMLDICRETAEMPFVVTSGFRTDQHQAQLKAEGYPVSENSAHLLGKAADIRCRNSSERFNIVGAAIFVGFTRIGISSTSNFVHLDSAEDKGGPFIWLY